jgi:hypothetical protein
MTTEITQIIAALPAGDTVKSAAIHAAAKSLGFGWSKYGKVMMDASRRRERGYYFIGDLRSGEARPAAVFAPVVKTVAEAPAHKPVFKLSTAVSAMIAVPVKDPHFIPWGNFDLIEQIISAGRFFPVFISGVSGNGKTLMVEQACARAKRQMVRVQITPETDEDSLIGGFRLVNGETVFAKGPVINAMETGAVLLVDEIDRSSPKLMCLQGVLEGKPVLIQKTGELVFPHPSFTVIATANTKGRGSLDGKYVYATMMDDAFLERFVINIEQEMPTIGVERRIIKSHMEKYGVSDDIFVETLANWSETIRKTYAAGGIDEIVSTRRLGLIVNTFAVVRCRMTAIRLCVNRFDKVVADVFVDLYTKIDSSISTAKP